MWKMAVKLIYICVVLHCDICLKYAANKSINGICTVLVGDGEKKVQSPPVLSLKQPIPSLSLIHI